MLLPIFLLSGISGAGKTRYTKDHLSGLVLSADDHFIRPDGTYHFNSAELGLAHGKVLHAFVEALEATTLGDFPHEAIVVDNPFTTALDLAPYVALANAYGITPTLTTLYLPFLTASRRNVHHVPEAGVRNQYNRLMAREIPPFWKIRREDLHWSESKQTYLLHNVMV